jgi:hypothetical protein
MFESITVDQAIKRGHRTITYPVWFIVFGGFAAGLCLSILKLVPFWVAPLSLFFSFLPAWLYWSVFITKWRLWAFENVRNVHELKKRAIREKLIWTDGSFFEKTEIRNSNEKELWEKLLIKFDQEDLFVDDPTVPLETKIYFSKFNVYSEIVIRGIILLGGGSMLLNNNSPILGLLLIAVIIYSLPKSIKKAKRIKSPQIILTREGMETSSVGYYDWSEINHEEEIYEGNGKNRKQILVYSCPSGLVELVIDDLNTDIKKLNDLLIIYRGRFKKASNAKNRTYSFEN